MPTDQHQKGLRSTRLGRHAPGTQRFSGTRSKGCFAPERKIGRVAPPAEERFSGSEKRKMAVDELADLAQHQSLTLRFSFCICLCLYLYFLAAGGEEMNWRTWRNTSHSKKNQSLTLRSASSCKNKRKPDLKLNVGSKIAKQLENHFANILPRENIFAKLEWSPLHENGTQRDHRYVSQNHSRSNLKSLAR